MQPLPGVRHHEGIDGAGTSGGQANAESMIKLLNDARASEIIAILCHKRQYYMTAGTRSHLVKAQFLEYVAEERADAGKVHIGPLSRHDWPRRLISQFTLREDSCRVRLYGPSF